MRLFPELKRALFNIRMLSTGAFAGLFSMRAILGFMGWHRDGTGAWGDFGVAATLRPKERIRN